MNNLSLWHVNHTQSELRNEPQSQDADDIRIESLFSIISTGTERMVAMGKVSDSLASKMSVPYMQGSFELPIKYGYSLVGRTEKGQLVHLLHPHQQVAYASPESLFTLPTDADPRRMTLLSNMETIINAIWDSEHILYAKNDTPLKIAVCGFGNIGALLATTLQVLFKTQIVVIEVDKWRREKAKSLGFETITPSDNSIKYDVLYHTSCTESGLQWCIENTCYEGSIIELSWYVDKLVTLKLGAHFHYNRLRLISSQVSNIPKQKPKETYESRKQYAVKLLLANNKYDSLFAQDVLLQHTPAFFDQLRSDKVPTGLVWCIKY